MSKPAIRCPDCRTPITTPPRKSGKYWCEECEAAVVGVVRKPPRDARPPARSSEGSGNGLLIGLIVGGVVLLAGLGVGLFFALKPKADEVAFVPPPPPPVAPVDRPTMPEFIIPPVPAPVPKTPEEIVRQVKAAAVYIRTTLRPGIVSTGSGFFAGKPGFVVTNAHVVGYGDGPTRPPARVEVIIGSGEAGERTRTAEVYGVDVAADLALLKVAGDDLPAPLPFGKASELVETQEVVIYGYPFGEALGKNISVNRSTVSSLRRESGKLDVVQLGGGLNPGNSGGPVTNARGEVIGVSVAKLRGAETIGFAIPAETALDFLAEQERTGGRFVGAGGVALAPPVKKPRPGGPPVPPAKQPDGPVVAPFNPLPSGPTTVGDLVVREVTVSAAIPPGKPIGKSRPLACLNWSADGKAFFAFDHTALVVRKFSYPDLKEVAKLEVGKDCTWLSLSAVGVVLTVADDQEAWVLDVDTLKKVSSFPVNRSKRVVSAPPLSVAYLCDGDEVAGQVVLRVVDLKTGKKLKEYEPKDFDRNCGFGTLVMAANGKHLFATGGFGGRSLVEFATDGATVKFVAAGPQLIEGAFKQPVVSADGKLVCAPSGGGNNAVGSAKRMPYSTLVFAPGNLNEPLLQLKTGAYPSVVGFDTKTGLIFAQNFQDSLIVIDREGTTLKSYKLGSGGPGEVHQFLPHPDGRKLLVLANGPRIGELIVHSVELPAK